LASTIFGDPVSEKQGGRHFENALLMWCTIVVPVFGAVDETQKFDHSNEVLFFMLYNV